MAAAIEELFEIERSIRGCIFEAERNLRLAEAEFGGKTVDRGATVAKSFFDGAAKRETDTIQIARDAGFVLAELSADFGQRLLLRVIKAQTLLIARIECGDSRLQCTNEKSGVAGAIGIGRASCRERV